MINEKTKKEIDGIITDIKEGNRVLWKDSLIFDPNDKRGVRKQISEMEKIISKPKYPKIKEEKFPSTNFKCFIIIGTIIVFILATIILIISIK